MTEPERPPRWLESNHPGLCGAVLPLAGLLRRYSEAPENAELEFRLGIRRGGRVSADVGFSASDEFLQRCGSGGDCAEAPLCFSEWREHMDYYYRLEGGTRVRTRVSYDSDKCTVGTVTVCKELCERIELTCGDWCVRCDHSTERPVPEAEVPDFIKPEHVALASRAVARYGPWRYDVTMRWDAESRTAVEALQRSSESEPQYLVEIEFVGSREDVERHGACYLMCSGLLKALDVVGCTGVPVTRYAGVL
jgi:hypothetical protein